MGAVCCRNLVDELALEPGGKRFARLVLEAAASGDTERLKKIISIDRSLRIEILLTSSSWIPENSLSSVLASLQSIMTRGLPCILHVQKDTWRLCVFC